MYNILLVEDDSFKARDIFDLISETVDGCIIDIATSLVEGIDFLNDRRYDFVVIDMAIPSHPTVSGGGAPMSLLTGGLEILLELNSLGRSDPCIVVTQYPEIELAGQFYSVEEAAQKIQDQLGCEVLECVKYSEGSDDWKVILRKILGEYERINFRR